MMYCKSKFGENDHRCPSNWAQGHAHSPDLDQEKGKKESDTKYGAFTFYYSQLQIQRQSRIPFQDKSLLLITQSLTLVRAGARDMFLLSTHPALPSEGGLGLRLVPRLWYGALRVHPVNEPWFTGTGRLVALAITFATSASSLDAASFINTCWRHRLFANGRPCRLFYTSFPSWHWPLHLERRSQHMGQKEPLVAQSPSGESTKQTQLAMHQFFLPLIQFLF